MKKHKKNTSLIQKRTILLIISVILSLNLNMSIALSFYTNIFILLWLASILVFIGFSINNHLIKNVKRRALDIIKKKHLHKQQIIRLGLIFLILLVPVIVRIFSYDSTRIHGDDMVTGYFSSHFDIMRDHFFGPVPFERVEWVSQFPSVFFVLQKIFFVIVGESILTTKLSMLPYVFVISLFLFLSSRALFNTKTAVISVILYSFFSHALYYDTLNLLFIGSTAIFICLFYLIVLYIRNPSLIYASLIGITCGFSYLFYTSSYYALPYMILAFAFAYILHRNSINWKQYLIYTIASMLGFAIVISPFITYGVTNSTLFLTQRTSQVSLLTGEWSGTANDIKNGKITHFEAIVDNAVLSGQSLYKNDMSGHGGYTFGKQAFFDPFTGLLFALGTVTSIYVMFKKKEWGMLFVWIATLTGFFIGVILTIPPPAFHRATIILPFVILIISSLFYVILHVKMKVNTIPLLVCTVLLLLFSLHNYRYFRMAAEKELTNIHLTLAEMIHTNYPDKTLYVASFPGYTFSKILHFLEPYTDRKVVTDYHSNILDTYNPNEDSIYVIIMPDAFDEEFTAKNPNGTLIPISDHYSLFVNKTQTNIR